MTRLVTVLALILAAVAEANAAGDINDYVKRIHHAAEQIDRIKADESYSDDGISDIKRLMPKSEEVETDHQTVAVDNSWLHAVLDEYNGEADSQQRVAKLDEAAGRLRALQESVRALQDDLSDEQGVDSRERIRGILGRSEYLGKSDDWLTAKIKEIRQKIYELIRDLFNRVFSALFGAGAEASWFLRAILIAFLATALMMAVRMGLKFRRGRKREKKRKVLGEELDEDLTPADLAEAALAAARSGDFRLAIRKLYISLLYELAERHVLELEANATNHDYLTKVVGIGRLAGPMQYLTDRFDYFWYGMFPATKEDFSAFLQNYSEGMSQARSLSEQQT